jgi:hypothetical protein
LRLSGLYGRRKASRVSRPTTPTNRALAPGTPAWRTAVAAHRGRPRSRRQPGRSCRKIADEGERVVVSVPCAERWRPDAYRPFVVPSDNLPDPPEGRRWVVWVVPPNGTLRTSDDGPTVVRVALWQQWLAIADEHADRAGAARASDWTIDSHGAALAGLPVPESHPDAPTGDGELPAAMIAIAASAHAIDGLYGSVKPLINPPPSKAARHRQILETLKLGFNVGAHANRWLPEVDWLFGLRDSIVHHAEIFQPVVVTRTTERTVVVGGVESFDLTAESARRAASLARDVIETCLANPKAVTRGWAHVRSPTPPATDADTSGKDRQGRGDAAG